VQPQKKESQITRIFSNLSKERSTKARLDIAHAQGK
jgi:hypothetical protein